jgi:site-specific recombinase XerD
MHISNPLRVEMSGPLSAFAAGFLEDLQHRGYRPGTAAKQLQAMSHLSRWMAERDVESIDLTKPVLEEFACDRRASGWTHVVSLKGLGPLIDYLRRAGLITTGAPAAPVGQSAELLDRYAKYLLDRRGMASTSVRNYVDIARVFLDGRQRSRGHLALDELDAATINEFVLNEARRRKVAGTQCVVYRLRSLLRFLYLDGAVPHDLTGAVPRPASWRNASLVKALDAQTVARLLGSCNVATAVGRRDLAVLMLLSRLGLRAGEVAAIQLRDIDWRAGEVMVRGKGSRHEQLPLPVDVGDALVEWLRDGRPRCGHQLVFPRVRAPHSGLSTTGIAAIVHAACNRAQLPEVGPHRLRHTAATEMLRAGASLSEVGQVLRHRHADTTSVYAKVDRRALAALVQPWPGTGAA